MRAQRPVLLCDAAEELCDAWDIDYYEEGASSFDGIQLTPEQRFPGWYSNGHEDFCPRHADNNM